MYGLINRSLKSMVLDHHGEAVWEKILHESGVPEDSFVSMRRYDDQVTYALAGAAAKVLAVDLAACLEQFGLYWATVTARESYGVLLDSTGGNLIEFLENINSLHDRITSTFIGYEPPYFDVNVDQNTVALRYQSSRAGLTPFVVGVVKGMACQFHCELSFQPVEMCAVDSGETSIIRFQITDVAHDG
ncbi:heme NO-binding domain-containing protein [Simiduia sp. 21SJ11W-1]|uniref:heme NO-binding domain-containing protein n=1 Tax=Simiduia sp. 21SJ11W-1 TaxID=2909669 RepID=UPI00209D6572|nr:heme NO-binding domain-containing protein [Simiduia sp. 21SJ11W-1]UTA48089.1 heme NO-binding domain-containing protein [Simiduia sp. 21SJ11W-1]